MVFLFYDPKVKEKEVRQWVQERFPTTSQRGVQIRAHAYSTRSTILSSSRGESGGDKQRYPGDGHALLEDASSRLDKNDVVIRAGNRRRLLPARMKPPTKGIFRDLPWGTSLVYRKSERVRRLASHNSTLPPLNDVDTAEAYRKYLMKKQKG